MFFTETELYKQLEPYIDVELLNEVYSTTLKKYGVENPPIIDPSTYVVTDWIAPMALHTELGEVHVNPAILEDILVGTDVAIAAAVVVEMMFHEQGHYIHHREVEVTHYENTKIYTRRSGYSKSTETITDDEVVESHKWYEILNEGVTDTLAMAMLDKYLQALGAPKEAIKEIHSICGYGPDSRHANNFNSAVADAVAEYISMDAGVSKKVAWQALVRGAISGDSLDDPDLKEWLNSATDIDNFVQRLRELELYIHDVTEFIEQNKEAMQRKQALR